MNSISQKTAFASSSHRRRHGRKVAEANKLKIVKESAKTVGRNYCAESSISGLKHLVDDGTSSVERFVLVMSNLRVFYTSQSQSARWRFSPVCLAWSDYVMEDQFSYAIIIWIIIMIGALICSISLVWITFRKYYRAPLVTTQMPEGVSVSKIIFPAVGICTNNRISKQAITKLAQRLIKEERNAMFDEEGMLSLLFGLGILYNIDSMDEEVVRPMQLHRALGEYNVNELMRDLTPRCEDLLLRCAWNEQPMDCSKLFDFRLTMNGYCCTFNYLRQSDDMISGTSESSRSIDMYKYGNKSNFDFDQGLKILMRLNESDDFYYNRPLQGAQLQFSDAYDFPDAPSGSFSMQIISPNVQMSVMVIASFTEASRDIQHVPVKLRQCLFYDESPYLTFYTHSDCMLKCRMSFLLDNCNCTPFNMPKMANTKTCDMSDVPCLRMFYAQSITVRPNVEQIPFELEMNNVDGGINCPMCYPTCSKIAYNYDFNNVKIYPDYLNSVPDTDRVDWLQGANFTGTSIVHVKHGREVADCYGQNVIMKWFDLISNIGSTCGFVTGFSFVSALEFIYYFTVKLWREVKKRRRRERRIRDVKMLITPQSESITKYHSLYWNELVGPTRWKRNINTITE